MDIFLWEPQRRNNLCLIARTLEIMGFKKVYLRDEHQIIQEGFSETLSKKLNKLSAGAWFRMDFQHVEDPLALIRNHPGRVIATKAPDETTIPLPEFQFQEDDLVIMGAENFGIPDYVFAECNCNITIPQYGTQISHNLAISTSIVAYEMVRQIPPQ